MAALFCGLRDCDVGAVQSLLARLQTAASPRAAAAEAVGFDPAMDGSSRWVTEWLPWRVQLSLHDITHFRHMRGLAAGRHLAMVRCVVCRLIWMKLARARMW